MTRLYVDVDDTLILWPKVQEGGLVVADVATPNGDVIRFVERWKGYHGDAGSVIVWSLGGEDYAAAWGRKCLSVPHEAMAKGPILPTPGDLFIDDDPLHYYRAANIHPDVLRGEQ